MLQNFLIWPGALLPFLTPVFLIAFWVVARKRFPATAIPWLIAYGAMSWGMLMLQKVILQGADLNSAMSALPQGSAAEAEAARIIPMLTAWLLFKGGIQMPLIVLLVLSNIAAALPDGPQESRVWRFFTGAYRWRHVLGASLLATVIGGSLSVWWAVGYLQSLAK